MSTSLAAQLQKLAVPQTSLLQRDKKRASLLFDPKVAAGIDRDTFYDIGLSGLRELQKYNDEFVVFENTLFSPTSRNIERAVESKESNAKLNKNIRKFLMMLSPYFLLKPAHKALEWLVNRFSIHEYNKDDCFKLILPYHETNMFARCLQLFNVHSANDRWHWLRALQKPGIHLPKLTLYNHCASDVGFLQFIADTVFTAVRENGGKSNALTTLFTFYCTTTIGALEHTRAIAEPQIAAILPPLLKGLAADVADYTASAYLITAQLVKKTKLSAKILNSLVVKISSDSQRHLRTEATLLLLLIYQSQQDNYTNVPAKALKSLVKCDWFAGNLGKLASGGSYVMPLLVPVVKSAMTVLQSELCRTFIERLVGEVRLGDAGAGLVIKIVLDLCPLANHGDESSSADDDDSLPKSTVPVAEWYAALLKQLETVYPSAFDQVVREVMSTRSAQVHRRALRSVMTFVMSSGRRNNSLNTFEKLYHPNAEFRATAVRFLVKHFARLTGKDKEMLEGAVRERMLDEDKRVVHAVLRLDADQLIELLSQDTFVNIAITLLTRCTADQDWLDVAEKLVEIVCSEQFCRDTKLFLPVLPFVFPKTERELAVAHKILASPFAAHHAFLVHAKPQLTGGVSAVRFCKIIAQSLVDDTSPRNIFVLLEEFKAMPRKGVIHKYLAAVFIAASLTLNCSAKLGLAALQTVTPHLAASKLVAFKNNVFCVRTCLRSAGNGAMPLQGLVHCIDTIVGHVHCPQMLNAWLNLVTPDESVNFLVSLLAALLQGCAHNNRTHVKLCSRLLRQFLAKFFPAFTNRINFLANMIVVDDFANLKLNVKSQLRIMNVLNALLVQSDNLAWTVDFNENILVPAALIGLTNPVREIRKASVDILVKITSSGAVKDPNTYLPLLQEVVERKEEILLDAEQLPLILGTVSGENTQLTNVFKHLFSTVVDVTVPIHISSMLLNILTFINSSAILETTSKLATNILTIASNSNSVLDVYKSSAFYNIVLRCNENTAKDLSLQSDSWTMLSYGLRQDIVSLEYKPGRYACPAVLILEQISREFYANLPFDLQHALFKLLVEIATEAENPDVVSSVNKVIKKINLDAKILLDDLAVMRDVKSDKTSANPKRKFRRATEIPTADILIKIEWKRGITVLEFIQDKKKLTSVNLLLPLMFGILKKCLDFDEQSSVEYPKQLLLSAILHCCHKMDKQDDAPLPANAFNMELVVQCIRASQNPQTHHHALLVLAHTAGLIPEQVLHNIMAIFTFMGSSVLRHDDAYSFQIISKIIETVIPILIRVKDSTAENNVAAVLRVFVDVILDVPEHRRMPLFHKLLVTLGVEEYLWLFLLLVFEAHVLHGNEPKPKDTRSRLLAEAEPLPKRLDVATNIALDFAPEICIKTSIQLLEYLKSLPMDKEDTSRDVDGTTFSVKQHSAKEFRHYKYTVVTFLSSLLSAKQLVNKIAVLGAEQTLAMEPLYKNIIIHILTYIQGVSKTVDRMASTPQAQYWKVMVHHCYDILDSVNALLTSEMFLLVIRGLIAHNIPTVRRKAMELLNTKLQYQTSFFYSRPEDTEITNTEGLFALMPALVGFVKSVVKADTEPEYELTQQTALLSLKLLIKLLAPKNPDKFTPVLDYVTELIKSDKVQGNILASVVLCLAELCSKLRAHAIPALVKFMPAVIKVLKMQQHQDSPGLLSMCIVTAIQKIVESLPLFLSPYLEKLLCELTVLSAKWSHEADKKLSPFVKKLAGIRGNIGGVIPSRVLIPVVGDTYNTLLSKKQYTAVGPLMNVLAENLATLHGSELTTMLPDLTTFFLAALQFRADNDRTVSSADITVVEDHVIKTLTVLVLKLSETTFRPFYYRLFDWAVRSETSSERVITFYRLSHRIAVSLKGLFVLFAGHFVKNASSLLDACNGIKNEQLCFTDDSKNILLVESILSTLRAVFLYDSQNFVDKDRFEALMQPIVDQLENTTGGVESLTDRASNLIVPCIAQFAVAAADDALWKQLNYQILLKTRHNLPAVRLIGLNCVLEVARKVGEDFLPLLPETIPFLAELLEDEDESVESTCQRVVQDLEKVLGEPLQKYF